MYLLTTPTILELPQWCQGLDEPTNPEDVIMQRRLDDSRLLIASPHDKGVTLAIGMPSPFHRIGVFADSWDYRHDTMAYYAFQTWDPTCEPEPQGWTHHSATGRYRIEGDPHREYVKGHGDVVEQVEYALSLILNETACIIEQREIPITSDSLFNEGTRCFRHTIQAEGCPHFPPCEWVYTVFHYQDRCVVLSLNEVLLFNRENVYHRLTSQAL